VVIIQIPRSENERVDTLARQGSATDEKIATSKQPMVILESPSIADSGAVMQIEDSYSIPEWAKDVFVHLKEGKLLEDKKEARKIRMQSARYTLIGGILYHRGYMFPVLNFLSTAEAEYVLKEIHEGVRGGHSGGRMLAHKAVRAGNYWLTMNRDSLKKVRRCTNVKGLQRFKQTLWQNSARFRHHGRLPNGGGDIVGPMPTGKGNCRFLVVAVDYFTKWVKAEPLATITTGVIKNFLWRAIVCQFGIPYALVTDNGTQFDYKQFQEWYSELKIRHFFSSVYHPQSNGQVEATNKTLVRILKKKITKRK